MSHMSSGFYRDRLGFDPNKESNNTAGQQASAQVAMSASSMSRRTVTSASAAYSSSSLSRQETQMSSSRHVQSSSSDRQSAAGHYAVSSHVSNGNLVVDNGNGVIQAQSGNHYEENLGKIKGRATDFWIIYYHYYPYLILKGLTFHVDILNLCC